MSAAIGQSTGSEVTVVGGDVFVVDAVIQGVDGEVVMLVVLAFVVVVGEVVVVVLLVVETVLVVRHDF
jgi:hypothetical protein